MQRTTGKKKRLKRRMIRRMMWRCAICLMGILILGLAWRVTSFAIRHLIPEKENVQETMESNAVQAGIGRATEQNAVDAVSEKLQTEHILLVNKDHPLDESYKPNLSHMNNYGVDVDSSIYKPLNDMLEAGEKEGLTFWIASAYRSTKRQRELLDEDIEALVNRGYSYSEAYEEVVRETMPVGCSEHATGLAVDIVAKDYQILDEKQGRTEEIKWLQKNCSQYGFILRYPEGKEDITKVDYESWHFRYVGVDAAEAIMSQGITLEEYLEASEASVK